AKEFKQLQGKDKDTIEKEVQELVDNSRDMFHDLGELINEVNSHIDTIYTPTFVVQARQDEMINTDSANFIYENVESDQKDIKWYEESGHVITIGNEKEQLFEDIYQFLESLNWRK